MNKNYVQSRQTLRELVEKGDIAGAIKGEAECRHGIAEFEVIKTRNEMSASDIDIDVYDTFAVTTRRPRLSCVRANRERQARPLGRKVECPQAFSALSVARRFSEPPYSRPVFLAGAGRINELEELSRKDARRGALRIKWGVAHEAGHVFRPKNPSKPDGRSVPWHADEIWARREKRGMDNYSLDASNQRDSQANLYALVKCNEDILGIGELKEHIAAMFWEAIAPDYAAIGRIPVSERETVIRGAAYNTVACLFSGMKPHIVDEIAELAVGKYRQVQLEKLSDGVRQTIIWNCWKCSDRA